LDSDQVPGRLLQFRAHHFVSNPVASSNSVPRCVQLQLHGRVLVSRSASAATVVARTTGPLERQDLTKCQGNGLSRRGDAEGLCLRVQVVEVGVSEGEKWGYPRITEMAAVR
jgi:hypothetical protein